MVNIFFFIGTEAELIKIFPVMIECKSREINYHIIASGQNNIKNSVIFQKADCGKVELELSDEKDIKKTALGLLTWWIRTYKKAGSVIKNTFPDCNFTNSYMIVHGDTVSTYMGARIGKKLGMTVCHVEAGLRSHHLLNPFPEEIDRLLTSRIARVHFAPSDMAEKNLKHAKGSVINTKQNTLLDSLRISEKIDECETIKSVLADKKPYFVFVMHRQENLANEKLVRAAVENVISVSNNCNCVLILHAITKQMFEKLGLLSQLEGNSHIILLPRVDYFSFMKLLNNSEFVITDGGSNQEELSYMGKPTLILRKTTERNEGIGKNAILFSDISDIDLFSKTYNNYIYENTIDENPSKKIVDYFRV